MNKNATIAIITLGFLSLIGFTITMVTVENPTKVEFSPTEGFTVETDVGPVPIPQNVRDSEESKTYPIGDVILENSIISNTHGFVISIPNDNWEATFGSDSRFIGNLESILWMKNNKTEEVIGIAKIADAPEHFDEAYVDNIKGTLNDVQVHDFNHYYSEESDSQVVSVLYTDCTQQVCHHFRSVTVLRLVDFDLFSILYKAELPDVKTKSSLLSPDAFKILNSFKII